MTDDLDAALDARLRSAGSADAAPPDDLTLARIERRLRDQHGRRPSRPNVLAPVLAGVAAALVVVALANVGGDSRSIGTAGSGRDLDAPELTVPPSPEDRDLAEEPREDPDPGDTGTDEESRDDRPGGSTTAPAPAPDPDEDADPATDGPTTTVPSIRDTTVDSRPTTTTTRPSDTKPTPARISVRVEARGKTAVITWSEYPGDDLTSWSIVRTTDPPEGSLAPSREEVVLRDGDPAVRRFVDEPDARGQVSYVVRGHRRDGAVLARSAPTPLER